MTNILIEGDTVTFEGFSELGDVATVVFYPSGIVILPYKYKSVCPSFIEYVEANKCEDSLLVEKLRERGILGICQFFFSDGKYFEWEPHKES